MVRIAVVLGIGLSLVASPALAAQATSSFTVGIVIGGPTKARKAALPTPKAYTWGAAKVSVSRAGYSEIRATAKDGGLYWFMARKGEILFRIAVSASTGTIEKVTPA